MQKEQEMSCQVNGNAYTSEKIKRW